MDIPLRANNLTRKYGTKHPFKLASALGINVRITDLPESIHGFYYRVLRRRFIVINDLLSDEWKRFVCAHELGHERLHSGLRYYFMAQNTFFNPEKFERQANLYAIHVLTAGEKPEEGESIQDFYLRNDIPLEVIDKT